MADKVWIIDDEPSARFPLYTRGNVGEVFPEVVAPLTWSTFARVTEQGWREAYAQFGALTAADFGDEPMAIIGVFGGYAYLNVSTTRIFAVRTPGLKVSDMDLQLFGESDAPPYRRAPGDRNPWASLRVGRTLLSTLRARSLPQLEADKEVVAAWLARLPTPDTATDAELLDAFFGYRPLFQRLFRDHILTTFQATVGPGLLTQICGQKLGDPTLTNTLLAGLGSVESAAPSSALWDLGRIVASDPDLTAAFDAGLDGLEDRLATLDGPAAADFDAQLRRFIDRHGSRGPNEWEFGSDTWGTKPLLALAAVDCMRAADPSHAPTLQHARLERDRHEATARARARLKGATRLQFDLALRSAQLFSQGRERSKTTVIRATHGARLVLRELARRARGRGGPDNLRDICLVTADELAPFVADPPSFNAAIEKRREQLAHLSSLVPPFVFEGHQPPPSTWAHRHGNADQPVAAGMKLTGIAGCPGVARGRARVVLDALDPRGLGPGEVLVAPITDPSWTPLFVPAEAVVVDVGAQMSHAIIVSRELGIPAVVSVTGATRSIPDGALIEVDGSRGVVTILEP